MNRLRRSLQTLRFRVMGRIVDSRRSGRGDAMLDRRIIELYDEYTHAPLARRYFLGRLARLTGSAAAAAAVLPLLEAGAAHAEQIAKDDARLETARVTYPGAAGEVKAYSARLKEKSRL